MRSRFHCSPRRGSAAPAGAAASSRARKASVRDRRMVRRVTPKRLYAITYARMEMGTPVGSRVRALREGMDLSLRELAERSGVSAPMLSQVERGETSPTLAVAAKIAAGLELSLSQLLRLDEGDGVTVVRVEERLLGGHADGHRYEVLTPPVPGQRAEVSQH